MKKTIIILVLILGLVMANEKAPQTTGSGGGLTTVNADLRYVTPNYAGTITASFFVGDGSKLSNVVGGSGLSTSNADLRYAMLTGATFSGVVTATAFIGSGAGLTGISAGSGISTSNADARYVSQNQTQPVTLNSLVIVATITANKFVGDGSALTGLPSGGITTENADLRYITPNFVGQVTVTTVSATQGSFTNITGTIKSSSQTYISTLADLTKLVVVNTANFRGNVVCSLNVSALSISANSFQANGYINIGNYGLVETLTAGENVVTGDVCYVSSDAKYYKANATNNITSITKLAMATQAISAAGSGTFLLYGVYTTSGLTVGVQYLSAATAGAVTATAPTGTGKVVRLVGTAESSNKLFFNPSAIWLVLS